MTCSIRYLTLALLLCFTASIDARDRYYSWWLDQYSQQSFTGEARCQICHEQISGGDGWNAYGWDLRQVFESNRLAIGGGFDNEQAAFLSSLRTLEEFRTDLSDPSSANYLEEILANAQPGWREGEDNRISFKDDTFKLIGPPTDLSCLTKIDASSIDQSCPLLRPTFDTIATEDLSLSLKEISSGFNKVVAITSANDSMDHKLYIVERLGKIWEIDLIDSSKRLFLDFSDKLLAINSDEKDQRGLIGFAFHPNYSENHLVVIHLSKVYQPDAADFKAQVGEPDHLSVISEWQIMDSKDGTPAQLIDEKELLIVERNDQNPKGGEVLFGPDDLLYISIGDEDLSRSMPRGYRTVGSVVTGTVLRIDINSPNPTNGRYTIPVTNPFVGLEGIDEVYAGGFRFPQGLSFAESDLSSDDSLSISSLFLSDKGFEFVEEINRIQPSDVAKNFGWNQKEGTYFRYLTPEGESFLSAVVPDGNNSMFIEPVGQYGREDGGSITPGVIFKGESIERLKGRYVFADNKSGELQNQSRLFYLNEHNTIIDISSTLLDKLSVQLIGADFNGDLYLIADSIENQSELTKLYKIQGEEEQFCFAVKAKNQKIFNICL